MARKLILEEVNKHYGDFTRLEIYVGRSDKDDLESYNSGYYNDNLFRKSSSVDKEMMIVIMLNYNNKPLMPLFTFCDSFHPPRGYSRMKLRNTFINNAERLACVAIIAFDKDVDKCADFLNKKFFSSFKKKLRNNVIEEAKTYLDINPNQLATFANPEKYTERNKMTFTNGNSIINLNILEEKDVVKIKKKVNDSTINRDKVLTGLDKYIEIKNNEIQNKIENDYPNIHANFYNELINVKLTKRSNPIKVSINVDKNNIFNRKISVYDKEFENFYLYSKKFLKDLVNEFKSLDNESILENIPSSVQERFVITINTDNVDVEDTDILKSGIGISKFDL